MCEYVPSVGEYESGGDIVGVAASRAAKQRKHSPFGPWLSRRFYGRFISKTFEIMKPIERKHGCPSYLSVASVA